MHNHNALRIWRAVLIVLILAASFPVSAVAQTPAWLEPRALNITDLVGQVPDDILRGGIISYGHNGIVVFQSSTQNGDTFTIQATIYGRVTYPSWFDGRPITQFGGLGQMPVYDHIGSAAPESWLRIYANGIDVTSWFLTGYIIPAELRAPMAGPSSWQRYPRTEFPLRFGFDGVRIPANMGSDLHLIGDYPTLTGVFTFRLSDRPTVRYLGTVSKLWQTYIGEGYVGAFQPLLNQLITRYGPRHDRVRLEVPPGANYIYIVYPPSPGDPYHAEPANRPRPIGGTVRLTPGQNQLGADLTFSGAFPLQIAWLDADQSIAEYLDVLVGSNKVTPPELVIPAGMPYNDCFTRGDCSNSVLEAIYNASMPLDVHFLQVEYAAPYSDYIPLRMAGPAWQQTEVKAAHSLGEGEYVVFLPVAKRGVYVGPEGCPCGVFAADGRMVNYLAMETR